MGFSGERSVSYTPEDQLAQEINDAIVKANGAPCKVTVNLLCTDFLPWECFEFGVPEEVE